MSFQKVVKPYHYDEREYLSFRTVSFQKVVKPDARRLEGVDSFRTVSFQKVVKRIQKTN